MFWTLLSVLDFLALWIGRFVVGVLTLGLGIVATIVLTEVAVMLFFIVCISIRQLLSIMRVGH